jgi:hypothetical protein
MLPLGKLRISGAVISYCGHGVLCSSLQLALGWQPHTVARLHGGRG